MKLTKAQREQVKTLFGGRCAYCGVELGERWHADHVDPVIRNTYLRQPGSPAVYRPERHHIGNIWPACAPCNLDKGQQTIEGFRQWIVTHLGNLHRKSIYKSVLRHGLVQETGSAVTFYFERAVPKQAREEG